ncbi:MAG: hypothetical protein IJ347_04835 [Faecalibacterium sp.]|nr:hypothetical protein [Faecalibacterium sp.]
MVEGVWCSEAQKTLICVDSYTDGVLKGRICNPTRKMAGFDSLSQFLVKMETLLDELQMPQAYTATRTFPTDVCRIPDTKPDTYLQKGILATFEVKVIFRRHTSWQGVITWQEKRQEQSFRSVLELVLLMDSALRATERREYA